jgi:hypothetical protein
MHNFKYILHIESTLKLSMKNSGIRLRKQQIELSIWGKQSYIVHENIP